jgi:hypothetical protein
VKSANPTLEGSCASAAAFSKVGDMMARMGLTAEARRRVEVVVVVVGVDGAVVGRAVVLWCLLLLTLTTDEVVNDDDDALIAAAACIMVMRGVYTTHANDDCSAAADAFV